MEADPILRLNRDIFITMINDKIIKQFLMPISRISINKMADTLSFSREALSNLLRDNIAHNDLPFLIDPIE